MKVLKIKLGDEATKTVWTEGEHVVSIQTCVPNPWNPNKMDQQTYEKTKLGVEETRREAARIPPIVVRPLPGSKRKLQIIDGFHRWKMSQEDGLTEINVYVIYVSTQRAMIMTAQLNYNRGEPDMEKYPQYLAQMIKEFDSVDPKYLSDRLPDSEDEIKSYLNSIDFELETVTIPLDADDDDSAPSRDASETDAILDLKFVVRQGAGEVIERELARLAAHLGGGKNVRGRALEVMAVLSSQTPDGSINAQLDEPGPVVVKKKKRKEKEN